MQQKKVKFLVGSLLIVSAIGYLITIGISNTSQYFFTVDELMSQKVSFAGTGMKVKGNVVNGSIQRDPDDYLNVNFLIISWGGFSENKGKPNEMGLYEDAKSAIQWLKAKSIKEKNIILYGESLGTGVAVEIAQNKNYAGVILESPFTSMVNMGKKHYPFFPVSLLLKDKFESYKKINNIFVPVLIMHGKVDKIVPYDMGKKMYELANEPKFFYSQEYGDHMIEYDEKLLSALKKFILSLN